MDFEKFKKVFDESFSKVTPDEFIQRMKNLGYEFNEASPIKNMGTIPMYKCDRCKKEHQLDETKVKDKQKFIPPTGCYEGDYWIHRYYYFECDCGRCIEVKKEHLLHSHNIEKDFTGHRGVCPVINKQ